MTIFGIVGWSGSGKTTLLCALLPLIRQRGYSVSTMKHTHHALDLDRPGKDSFRHREAGAREVVLMSSARWTLLHEVREGEAEPTMDEVAARMEPVDLLLIEGFKHHPHPKLEVHRPALGKPALVREDPTIVAVASDAPLDDVAVPCIDLNDTAAVVGFILAHCGLEPGAADAP